MKKPTLHELGTDLLHVPMGRRIFALFLPFGLAALYFALAKNSWWPAALGSLVLLSFFTYGSVSHDLVHETYRLPRRLNRLFLSLIEALCLRSGHAYRFSHLYHHRRFPHADDIEGRAAHQSAIRALWEGISFQERLWLFAWRSDPPHRVILIAETTFVAGVWSIAIWQARTWPALLIYAALMHAGSWIIPFMTSYFPHHAAGRDELTQTKLFRGWGYRVLFLDHLFHLEHHLYPAVPHQNWARLARRLDPYFEQAGLRPVAIRHRPKSQTSGFHGP